MSEKLEWIEDHMVEVVGLEHDGIAFVSLSWFFEVGSLNQLNKDQLWPHHVWLTLVSLPNVGS